MGSGLWYGPIGSRGNLQPDSEGSASRYAPLPLVSLLDLPFPFPGFGMINSQCIHNDAKKNFEQLELYVYVSFHEHVSAPQSK